VSVEAQIEQLKRKLKQRTGCLESDMQVVYSPLRVSPLGAHVDHQDGLVTGMTLDQAIVLVFAPRNDRRISVESVNFRHPVEFEMDDVPPRVAGDWATMCGAQRWPSRKSTSCA
jgi:galactokinase